MGKYALGLDIGIASIGVAGVAIDQQNILFAGVHLFDAAENPKNGASLAEPRRNKRGLRRVTHRRAQRKREIRKLLAAHDVREIESIDLSRSCALPIPVWQLREHALRRPLTDAEFARVLFHIAKRRGYQSNRKDKTATDKADENKKVLKGATDLKRTWEQSGLATIGAYLATLPKQRNGDGTYDNMVIRDWLRDEVDCIFEAQQRFGNPKATERLCAAFKTQAFTQRPLQSFADKVGFCEHFPAEKRAPKNAPSAELFVLWSRLNNMRIRHIAGRDEEPLSLDAKQRIADLALKQAKVTCKQVRKLLTLGDEARFNISYRKMKPEQDSWEKIRDAVEEKTIVAELKGYHALKAALHTGSETDWLNRFHSQRLQLDAAAQVLSFENDEGAILAGLQTAGFTEHDCSKLKEITSFSKTVALSLKAIDALLPFMQQGDMYSAAVIKAQQERLLPERAQQKKSLLPPFENTNNPVVNRALAQARKVINACIRTHGVPETIIVELARDVGKPFDERRKIEKKIEANRAERADAAQHFTELTGNHDPRGGDILKYRLWKEQGGYCVYSGEYIDPARLKDDTAVQVDHILPYSRTFDDSYMNKVLVLADENQRKGNKTPVEYFKEQGRDVANLAAFASEWRLPKPKADRLLREELGHSSEEGFKERNLNDTRYMARLLKNHIEAHLELGKGRRVQTRNGALTAHLRGGWGFPDKNRRNDRHHALDAIVLACSTESMVQEFAKWNRYQKRQGGEKSYPAKPWESFRTDTLAAVDKIFVSRMPSRKVTGAAHEDTIRRIRTTPDGGRQVIQRVRLSALKLSTLENMVDLERNRPLYDLLKARLVAHGDKADKAFAAPVYMPTRDPAKQGPRVHGIRILTSEKSGVEINGGLASNGDMVRTDVFCKNGKYYLCPIYVHHFAGGVLPNRVVKANTPEEQWPEIEDEYFLFSLSRNDLVCIRKKGEEAVWGYFNGMDRSTGAIAIRAHDNDPSFGKNGLLRGIGVNNLLTFEKYTVNYFGDKHRIIKEKRRGLAFASHSESRQLVAETPTASVAE